MDWDDLDFTRGTFEGALEEGEHKKDYWVGPKGLPKRSRIFSQHNTGAA